MNSIFALKTKQSDLKSSNQGVTNSTYQQILPTRSINGTADFQKSDISFQFNVAGTKWFVPSRSYFRMRVVVSSANAPLNEAFVISPGVMAAILQGAELRVNGKTVSRISDNLGAIYAENLRVDKSQSWLYSVGASTNAWGSIVLRGLGTNVADKIEREYVFQPPLGIFNISHALPSGDYEIVLRPQNGKVKTAAIEEINKQAVSVELSDFEVESLEFFMNSIEGQRSDDVTYLLDLEETNCHVTSLNNVTSDQTHHFTVEPSTYALSVAAQDKSASSDKRFPPTKFIVGDKVEQSLNRLRIQYAGQSYPTPDWSGRLDDDSVLISQMYMNNIINSGGFFDTGGSEDIDNFIENGVYYHVKVPKDGSDRSTRCEVTVSYSTAPTNANLLLFSKYRTVAKVTVKDGRVVDVQMEVA